MPTPERDISPLTADQVDAPNLRNPGFVWIDGGTDFGEIRLTTRDKNFTGNVDGSSQTWEGGAEGLRIDRVSQSNKSILDVSSISMLNVYDTDVAGHALWTQREVQFGLKNRRVIVWDARWDPADPSDAGFLGAFIIFKGRIGGTEHLERSTLTLVPLRTPYNVGTGRLIQKPCWWVEKQLFKDTETCQYAGADTTCAGTEADCLSKGNIVHYGGFLKMLLPNSTLTVGNQRVSL